MLFAIFGIMTRIENVKIRVMSDVCVCGGGGVLKMNNYGSYNHEQHWIQLNLNECLDLFRWWKLFIAQFECVIQIVELFFIKKKNMLSQLERKTQ